MNTKNTYAHLTETMIKPFITVKAVFTHELTIDEVLKTSAEDIAKTMKLASAYAYTFKADRSLELKIGDYALVHANNELKIVQICEVHDQPQLDPDASYQYKWLVDKVNLAGFKFRQEEAIKAEALYREMEFLESQSQMHERFEQASKKNSGFASKWQDFLNGRAK